MNAGLPRILTKKSTGLIDIIVFILKYCLLLDTSELFVASKMELNKNITSDKHVNVDCNKGFDLIDFFTEDLFTDTKFFIGGAAKNEPGNNEAAKLTETAKSSEPAETAKNESAKNAANNKRTARNDNRDKKRLEEQEKLDKEDEIKQSANDEFQKKQNQTNSLEKGAKLEVEAKIENSLSIDTGKTGDESVSGDLLEMIKDTIADGALTVSKKVKGFVMIFIYASVYPAVPFFAVMAAMLAMLKYLFYKLRVF